MRPSGRKIDQMRKVSFERNFSKHAEGSCLVKFGDTHVLVTASLEEKTPPWLRNSGKGWVTAEYGMLPRSTHERMKREAASGKQGGRTQEIQRLIGRSLRAVVDLQALGERQISIDCDVIQADGGTRTASITGGFVAMALALKYLREEGVIDKDPIQKQAAAISVGLYKDHPVLDLDYPEDSGGEGDMNVVMSSDGGFIEIQGTGEERPMTRPEVEEMMRLAEKGCTELFEHQMKAIG